MTDSYASVDGIWLDGLEFCSRVYLIHAALMRRTDAACRLRLRPTDFEKKLLEELLPLCRYIQTVYGPGRQMSVHWLSGDQSYDAEYLQRGAIVDNCNLPSSGYIEITGAMHPNEHLLRERLESHGHAFGVDGLSVTGTRRDGNRTVQSEVMIYSDPETIAAMTKLVLESIHRKAGRYADHTTLIVECTLNTLYLEDNWQALIAAVSDARPEHSFDGVFICSVSRGYVASLGRP
ncbi:hypothetical protein ACFPTO_02160 [Paraburkholderia denitrificans]|uniref:Uncharacterized protein n=1 Tax=Paraburkholderia denitrificans TaxID=694025 RepID=A0ABW0J3L7_9BURK